jgi:DnaJ-class molecular chaperone
MAGFVYVLSNPSFPTLKIGKSERDPARRVSELSNSTGLPTPFKLEYYAYVEHHDELERRCHDHFSSQRVAKNREFFEISVVDAIQCVRQLAGTDLNYEKQYGHAGVDPNTQGGASGPERSVDAFGDIFGDGQDSGSSQVYRGNDLSYAMEITLEEAAAGKDSQIRIPSWDDCNACDGTGAKPGTQAKTCTTCHGSGLVQMHQGFFSVQQTCPHCHGKGKIIADPCGTCHGLGKNKTNKTLEFMIPAGIGNGMRIRSNGNGEPDQNGGPPGDLFIEIRLRKHDIFERDGDDLHCQVPVNKATAALGGEIDVPTLGGKTTIEIPGGTQHGKTFRLPGKGIKGVKSSVPGDLYCHVVVETHLKSFLSSLKRTLNLE